MAWVYERLRLEARKRLADGIRRERGRLGLTQEAAAELVGYSLQYLQRIERQIVNVPIDTVARFAFAFRVDPVQLLARNGRPGRGRS
jgi:transcriptional regulator with XRE-family HTH domain